MGKWLEENAWKWSPSKGGGKQWKNEKHKSLSWRWWTAKFPPSVCAFLCFLSVVTANSWIRLTTLGYFHMGTSKRSLDSGASLPAWGRLVGCIVVWFPPPLILCTLFPSTMLAFLALSVFLLENKAGIVKANSGSQVGFRKSRQLMIWKMTPLKLQKVFTFQRYKEPLKVQWEK